MTLPNPKPTLLPEWASDTTVVLPWAPSTAYTAGTLATNGANVYEVVVAGTSAASGGPTGTGSSILDGTVEWRYLGRAGTAGGITEPLPGRKKRGWINGEAPPAGFLNWVLNLTYKWTQFLETFAEYRQIWQNAARFEGPDAWAPTTAYVVGEYVANGILGRVYVCTVAGTSAGAGGPSGTGTGIVDGTVTWDYVAPPFEVTTPATLGSRLDVAGALTVGGTVDVTGATALGGTLTVAAATTVGTSLDVGTTLDVGGATTVGGSLAVTGPTTLNNGVVVTGTTDTTVLLADVAAVSDGLSLSRTTVNSPALVATGNGTGAAAELTGGATGPGARLAAGTAATGAARTNAVVVTNGDIDLSGVANPDSTVAFTDTITPINITKAWAVVTSDGLGGLTLNRGFNIAAIGADANALRITFAAPFADAYYVVTANYSALREVSAVPVLGNETLQCDIRIGDGNGILANFHTQPGTLRVSFIGAQ